MSDAVDDYLTERDYVRAMAERPFPHVPDMFLAQITGAREVVSSDGTSTGSPDVTDKSVNFWIYSWTSWTGTVNSNSFTRFAVNGAEINNTNAFGEQSYGVSTKASSPKVELLSIGNKGESNPVVLMHRIAAPIAKTVTLYESDNTTTNGSVAIDYQYLFSAGNEVKVTC